MAAVFPLHIDAGAVVITASGTALTVMVADPVKVAFVHIGLPLVVWMLCKVILVVDVKMPVVIAIGPFPFPVTVFVVEPSK
jgi:hypothetical protein